MDYIAHLRKYVGHAPLQMVGAAALILDGEKQLLLLKRADSGCWGPPGGAVELGEPLEAAARRETLEETGLELGQMTFFGIFSGPELYYKYPNGDEVYNVTAIYLTEAWNGEVRLNEEHTAWGWFRADEIPEDLSPPIKPAIDKFRQSVNEAGDTA
jgi:8-oxo-dGTP pyrophosphatase MutT (NUDIX family)